MSTRTVVHGLFDYTRTRRVSASVNGELKLVEQPYVATALRGDVIEVNDADLERGERLGALVDGSAPVGPPPVVIPAETPEVAGGSEPQPIPEVEGGRLEPVDAAVIPPATTAVAPERPQQVAAKALWVDYAVARHDAGYADGLTREEAEASSKQDLIGRYPAAPTAG